MFLLVSGRHVGAHTDGHQHGVSIQISTNLGKKFLRISCVRKIALIRILARVFTYLPSFISQILDLIYWTVLILIFIYFELRDTENQQYVNWYVQNVDYRSCTTSWNHKLKKQWLNYVGRKYQKIWRITCQIFDLLARLGLF